MYTYGRGFGYSDAVTLDTAFPHASTFIYVATTAGNIVYENTAGEQQVLIGAAVGYHPIVARKILTSGTVNGIARTTTAVGLSYCTSSPGNI